MIATTAENPTKPSAIYKNVDRIKSGFPERDRFLKYNCENTTVFFRKIKKTGQGGTLSELDKLYTLVCTPTTSRSKNYPLTGQDVILSPIYSDGQFTGTWGASDEDFSRFNGHIVNPDDSVRIQEGFSIDLREVHGICMYNMLVLHPFIAPTKELIPSCREAFFYIEDVALESKLIVNATRLKHKAFGEIAKASPQELLDVCSSLGLIVQGGNIDILQSKLYGIIDGTLTSNLKTQDILDAFTDPNKSVKALFYNCRSLNIIQEIEGVFKFREVTLGVGFENTIVFLNNVKNIEIRNSIKKEFEEMNVSQQQ